MVFSFKSVTYPQVKREELLQFAQAAIAGLKLNADLGRLLNKLVYFAQFLDSIVWFMC